MATPTVGDWLDLLDEWYPPSWAEPWDSVGLQAGDRAAAAERVLVALDPTLDVVEEAASGGFGLLVTHHPLVFRPLASLDVARPAARTVAAAIRSGVSVAACHTNADVARPGVSDALADALGVEVSGPLRTTAAGERAKLVTFVPPEATAKVLDAVAQTGAGVIGEYAHCSFRVRGTGTFLPSDASNPVAGERGRVNEVEEDRLEIVVPRERLGAATAALVDAHPYEEVAYDVYPLAGGSAAGLGRVARLASPVGARALAERCGDALGGAPRVSGDAGRPIATVALCGGSGADLIPDALRAGADALVTGDVKHHQAMDAAAAGLTVVDAGHHATEWPFVEALAARLRAARPGAEVRVSAVATDPWA